MNNKPCIMIIAGEASGDLHGANLINSIHKKDNNISFYGIGGQLLKSSGVKILFDASKLSVVGLTEVFSKLSYIIKGLRIAKNFLKFVKPNLLILIDFPDFNFLVASYAKKLGIPVLYYISPQIWAWRKRRVKKIKKIVDHLAVILPFEKDFFKQYHIPVTYVGHPLLDTVSDIKKNTKKNTNIIGLLPGSREKEVIRLLPLMIKSANILTKQMDNIKFIVSLAPTIDRYIFENILKNNIENNKINIDIYTKEVKYIFEKSNLVIAASGTVTLEAAISGIPAVIIYKVSTLSYLIGKRLIKVDYIGLANLIAKEKIFPELLQKDANPINIASCVYEILNNPSKLRQIEQKLLKVKKLLGNQGASDRTAEIAFKLMKK